MRTRVAYGLVLGLVIASLSGCGTFNRPQREAWRGQVELACLKSGAIVQTSFVRPAKEIDGPGTCGLDHPFEIYAVSDGAVGMTPRAKLGCPMAAAMNVWMRDVVQPASLARFGVQVAEIKNMASYGCRTRNNRRGAKMSEHSYGNGLDIGGFILVDGREVSVLKDWRGGPVEAQAFLREVHAGACGMFKTVLGPGSDRFHENHLHLDLARHNSRQSAYCRPKPQLPDEPLVSQAPTPDPYRAPGGDYRSLSREGGQDYADPQGRRPAAYAPQEGEAEPEEGEALSYGPGWRRLDGPLDTLLTGSLRKKPDLLETAPEDYEGDE